MKNSEAKLLIEQALRYATTAQYLFNIVTRAGYKVRQKSGNQFLKSESVIDWNLDPDKNLSTFLQAWYRVYGNQPKTSSQVAKDCDSKSSERVLRLLVQKIDGKYGHRARFIECGKIGMYLHKHQNKVKAGLVIQCLAIRSRGKTLWRVVEVEKGDAVLFEWGYSEVES